MFLMRMLGAFIIAVLTTAVISAILRAAQTIWDPLHSGPIAAWQAGVIFGGLLYFGVRDAVERHRRAAVAGRGQ